MSAKNPNPGAEAASKTSASNSTPAPATASSASKQRGPLTLDMSVNIAGIRLKNPILAAAGTFGYGVEFEDIVCWTRKVPGMLLFQVRSHHLHAG